MSNEGETYLCNDCNWRWPTKSDKQLDEIVNNEYAVKSKMSDEGEIYLFRFHFLTRNPSSNWKMSSKAPINHLETKLNPDKQCSAE